MEGTPRGKKISVGMRKVTDNFMKQGLKLQDFETLSLTNGKKSRGPSPLKNPH